jgi:hypothetical protein
MALVSPNDLPHKRRFGRFIAGVVIAMLGLALMGAVMLAAYGRSSTAHHWQFTLGLAVPLMLSLAAQSLIIVGSAMIGAGVSQHGRR